MITRDDILDALAKCAAYDNQHTPVPSRILVQAWVEHFEVYAPSIERGDLLAAVTEYHREPRDRMLQPADLSGIARAIRRDQLDREPLDSPRRIELEAKAERKAAIDKLGQSWPAEPSTGRPDRPRTGINPLSVRCPFCGADASRPCTIGGVPGVKRADIRKTAHPSRVDAAQKAMAAQ
ncbi:zinc finger domain-containing protein [Mycobacterium heckeshornense]|uniref:zinc finger domain-containing protein n=1 Tax=Mycobacterium heckeshornense TaxID=110505 RepID=UPI0008FCFED9|nr:hypothetical protein [Mycobacterium heckeshornense]